MLDKDIHTFDWVRQQSAFLFSTVLCVTARFFRGGLETRPDVDLPYPPQQAKSIHHRCLTLAHRHQAAVFHAAIASFDVVQGIVLLAIWKEADDDKAAHRFNRVRRFLVNSD